MDYAPPPHDREGQGRAQLSARQGLAMPQGPISPPEYADAPMAKLILYTPPQKSSTTARRSAYFGTSTYGKTTQMA